jgi:hypothetical protein
VARQYEETLLADVVSASYPDKHLNIPRRQAIARPQKAAYILQIVSPFLVVLLRAFPFTSRLFR